MQKLKQVFCLDMVYTWKNSFNGQNTDMIPIYDKYMLMVNYVLQWGNSKMKYNGQKVTIQQIEKGEFKAPN